MPTMAKEKPPRIGRPPVPEDERLEVWPLRVSSGTRADIEALAAAAGVSPTQWARAELERAVARAKKRRA